MLVDPDFVAALDGHGAQTLAFVKAVMRALLYVDVMASGGSLTCQVKTGDGVNKSAIVDVSIRTIAVQAIFPNPQVAGLISVSVGTAQVGAGTQSCWLKTDSSGAFAVSISGPGSVLVEISVHQGVSVLVGLSL